MGILLLLVKRRGILAVVFLVTISNMLSLGIAAPLHSWYADAFWLPLVVVLAIAVFAFHTSLAGRSLLREALLES